MFALEIHFNDGVTAPETVLVRRPVALVGGEEYAHVVIDDMRPLSFQIKLIRKLGRKFDIFPVGEGVENFPSRIKWVKEGFAKLDLGVLSLRIMSLDHEAIFDDSEAPDKASVNILRNSSLYPLKDYPAVAIESPNPAFISFREKSSILVGRSKKCALRLDSANISSEHLRIGFDNGQFWVEDLNSTNGTFFNGSPISSRIYFNANEPISIANEFNLFGVVDANVDYSSRRTSDDEQSTISDVNSKTGFQIPSATRPAGSQGISSSIITSPSSPSSPGQADLTGDSFNSPITHGSNIQADYSSKKDTSSSEDITSSSIVKPPNSVAPTISKFPAIVSRSEVARPNRIALKVGETIHVGRIPTSDIWLGAPHISREHCLIQLMNSGEISITDKSTNGTVLTPFSKEFKSLGNISLPTIIRNGESVSLGNIPLILDFGHGVTVAICLDKQQEYGFVGMDINGTDGVEGFDENASQGLVGNALNVGEGHSNQNESSHTVGGKIKLNGSVRVNNNLRKRFFPARKLFLLFLLFVVAAICYFLFS